MVSLEAFKAHFESHISESIHDLEALRKRTINKILLLVLATIVLLGGGIYLLNQKEKTIAQAGFIALVVIFIILIAQINKGKKKIKTGYKDQVIRPMISFISSDLNYFPKEHISRGDYAASKIFLTKVDRYSGDDLVDGQLGDTRIRFSEIHSEYRTKDSNGKSQWHTTFKGIFFMADFNKHFPGETFVLPDFAEKWLGSFGKWMQKVNMSRPELIKLENPEFEKAFVVYGTDQVEARYILSPKMMERIMELKDKAKNISMSFVGNHVNIAIKVKGNLFEPPLWTSMKKFSLVEKYFSYLILAVNVVEDLDLNTRIWTKE